MAHGGVLPSEIRPCYFKDRRVTPLYYRKLLCITVSHHYQGQVALGHRCVVGKNGNTVNRGLIEPIAHREVSPFSQGYQCRIRRPKPSKIFR